MKIELIKETEKDGQIWYILKVGNDLPQVLGHDEKYALDRYNEAVSFVLEHGDNSVKETIKSFEI